MEAQIDDGNSDERRATATASSTAVRQSCCDVESGGGANIHSGILRSYCQNGHHHSSVSSVRNIEIDWREVDPYFSELSDCASFWTLINFTCDVIYSGLFVLFFIMGQDVESMFFEGLLNHINPILVYLILSLIINYGALRSLRSGREKCFLVFSIMKGFLFPITLSLLVYLAFFDVQEYFGTFWISFVVIVTCYNCTSCLGLWSMFTCNKYILVNEAAQKRMRKQAKQERSNMKESDCRCASGNANTAHRPQASNTFGEPHQNSQTPSSRPGTNPLSRNKIGDSSCANANSGSGESSRIPGYGNGNFTSVYPTTNQFQHSKVFHSECGPSRIAIMKNKTIKTNQREESRETSDDDGVLSFEDDDEVLQISTVHKVMQEIRLLDSARKKRDQDRNLSESDDGESL